MKRYNRWFNLITSIVVDVFVGLFFIFASLPSIWETTGRIYDMEYGWQYYGVYRNLFLHPFGCCKAASACMIAFIVFSTASLVIDILHAAGPFKESKAYRMIHICFSFTCFGWASASVACISVASVGRSVLAELYCCIAFVSVLTVLEGARFVMGLIADYKAKNDPQITTSTPREVKYNSDYAVKKLKDLKDLFNQGIISEEEYNEAKKKYVKDL